MIKTTKIQSGLTIYDYSNILLGGFDSIVQLIRLNPDFESMDVDLGDFVTKDITYDDSLYVSKAIQIELPAPPVESDIKYVQGLVGQNLYDLILMDYASFDNIGTFLRDNNYSINDHDVAFKVFNFNRELGDKSLTSVIERKGYVFASGFDSNFRITTDGDIRITTDGDFRIV